MSFFEILKRKLKPQNQEPKTLEEKNKQYLDLRNREIQRLQKAYDFNSIDGIRRIPVPCREVNGDSPTGRVEYYLRGLCFREHWDGGRKDLAIECLKKSQELIYISDMIWQYDDFIRLVSVLYESGRHDEARAEEKRIELFFEKRGFYPKLTPKDFENISSYKSWKQNVENAEKERLRKKKLRHEYYYLQENFPDLCPKSMSGYSRVKNQNSKTYKEILEKTDCFKGLE